MELSLDFCQKEPTYLPAKDVGRLNAQLKNLDFNSAYKALLSLTARNGIMLNNDALSVSHGNLKIAVEGTVKVLSKVARFKICRLDKTGSKFHNLK